MPRRRRKGKTDLVDAEAAARAVLAKDATAVPKDRRGPVGELRCLVIARRSAVKTRSQAANQIKALLVDGDDSLRRRLQHPRARELVARTRVELADVIFEYLEIFHSRQRRHSALGLLTPIEYEALTTPTTAA